MNAGVSTRAHAVQHRHLVERPVQRALGRGAVIPEDVVDQRVVEDLEVLQRLDQAADVMVGVREKRGVDLHLPRQHRFHLRRHRVERGDFRRPLGELGISGNHAERLLARKGFFADLVPALVELSLELVDPFLGHLMGRVRGTGRVVHEERLVGHQRLLLAHPPDRLVGHVLGEVVPLFRRLLRLDRRGALIDGGIVLIGLAADEAVEVLEAAAARRPLIERPHRARLPDRHLVTFAELRGRVAIELEGHGQRRLVLREHRRVTGSRRGDFADAAHVHRMVIASGEERLACRRAERGGVKAIELEAVGGQPVGGGRRDRAPERARGAKAAVIDQHDQHVGRTLRRPQGLDRRKLRVRILRIVRGQSHMLTLGDRQDGSLNLVGRVTHDRRPSRLW